MSSNTFEFTAFNDSSRLQSAKRIVVISDFADYTQAFTKHDDAAMAEFVNAFYAKSVEVITGHRGRVVKFMGDACLAVFTGDAGRQTVHAMLELRRAAMTITAERGITLGFGARAHYGVVIEGRFGPPDHARYDVIGSTVNTTALMGGGSGMWISDQVYRQLDVDAQAHWSLVDPSRDYRYLETANTGEG